MEIDASSPSSKSSPPPELASLKIADGLMIMAMMLPMLKRAPMLMAMGRAGLLGATVRLVRRSMMMMKKAKEN